MKHSDTPEIVADRSSGQVRLAGVSIQTVEVVLWLTVSYIQIEVTRPVNHNSNGPSLTEQW